MSEEVEISRPAMRMPWWAAGLVWVLCVGALLPLFLAASWAGGEVAKYQVTTFEDASRQALKAGDYEAAMRYCNGALKAGHNRSEHWGRVYMLRALAYMGEGRMQMAANEMVLAGDFFSRRYYYAKDQDHDEVPKVAEVLGKKLLEQNKPELALQVFSAGVISSGHPVEALFRLNSSLSIPERNRLWGPAGEPRIVLNARLDPKDNAPKAILNEQTRSVGAVEVEKAGEDGKPGLFRAEIGASQQDGDFLWGVPVYVPLDARPFGLRVRLKDEPVLDTKVVLSYWFESPQKSSASQDQPGPPGPDGWRTADIRREFQIERANDALKNGYSPEGGIINQVSLRLPPGAATTLSLGQVELYLPKG